MSYPGARGSLATLGELVRENQLPLSQLRDLVAGLSPAAYQQAFGADGRHTIGRHVRHIIDHYEALLRRQGGGERLNYESRRRDPHLEHSPSGAAQRLDEIMVSLASLEHDGEHDRLELDYPLGRDHAIGLASCLGRELAFLSSHTIHHMAILGLLAELLGQALPADFGVHPSTLRYWQTQVRPSLQGVTA